MQGIEKNLTSFPIPLHIRAPKTQPRKVLKRLHLILITCKLPMLEQRVFHNYTT